MEVKINDKKLKKIITKVISEMKKCVCCGSLISEKEYEAGEGACFKCWDK